MPDQILEQLLDSSLDIKALETETSHAADRDSPNLSDHEKEEAAFSPKQLARGHVFVAKTQYWMSCIEENELGEAEWAKYAVHFQGQKQREIYARLSKGALTLWRWLVARMYYYNWSLYSASEAKVELGFASASISKMLKELRLAGAVKAEEPVSDEVKDALRRYFGYTVPGHAKMLLLSTDLIWRGEVRWAVKAPSGHVIQNRSAEWRQILEAIGAPEPLDAVLDAAGLHSMDGKAERHVRESLVFEQQQQS